MQVIYYLAIAKIALKIQAVEKENFSKLFIHLGAIMLSYFKSTGRKFIRRIEMERIEEF